MTDTPGDPFEPAAARRALAAGELIVVPTDTIYGIAAAAADRAAVERLYVAKGRDRAMPTAAMFASVSEISAHVSGLSPRALQAFDALLPGPWTLIVSNPTGCWPWLTGGVAAPLGVRVAAGALDLPPIAATSANPAGMEPATSIGSLDRSLGDEVSIAIDRGVLPSDAASTILDLVAWEHAAGPVRVVRDPQDRAQDALDRLAELG